MQRFPTVGKTLTLNQMLHSPRIYQQIHTNVLFALQLQTQSKNYTGSVNWAPSSEFVSSSIPSLQILIAHAQPFRGARDPAFCLKVPLDSLLVWASSEGSGETARMRRLAWTFAACIGDKYQIRLTRSNLYHATFTNKIVPPPPLWIFSLAVN